MYCPNCGEEIINNKNFCPNCGCSLNESSMSVLDQLDECYEYFSQFEDEFDAYEQDKDTLEYYINVSYMWAPIFFGIMVSIVGTGLLAAFIFNAIEGIGTILVAMVIIGIGAALFIPNTVNRSRKETMCLKGVETLQQRDEILDEIYDNYNGELLLPKLYCYPHFINCVIEIIEDGITDDVAEALDIVKHDPNYEYEVKRITIDVSDRKLNELYELQESVESLEYVCRHIIDIDKLLSRM